MTVASAIIIRAEGRNKAGADAPPLGSIASLSGRPVLARSYSRDGAALSAGAVECGLGTVPLQGDGTLAENVIDLDDAIFDRTVEPPQAIVGTTYLPLQREKPEINGRALRRLGVLVVLAAALLIRLSAISPLSFSAVAAAATLVLISAIRRRRDALPFRMACLIFLSAFATLAASF
jgi:hypothetical protein